jgi:hypothetical protein
VSCAVVVPIEEAGPLAVGLVEVLTDALMSRVALIRAAVAQLPEADRESAAAAVRMLGVTGSTLATMGADRGSKPSALAHQLRRLSRRVGQLEEVVWLSLSDTLKAAEAEGVVR